MRSLVLLGILVALGACTQVGVYHQPGQPTARAAEEEARCAGAALAAHPVNMQSRYVPGIKQPRRLCDAAGRCKTVLVQITRGRWERYDANLSRRANAERSCMAAKGYTRRALPPCPEEVVADVTPSLTAPQPPITENSCAIRLKGGYVQVVTPGG